MPYSGLDFFKDSSPRLPPDWSYEAAALDVVLGWSGLLSVLDHEGNTYQAVSRFLVPDDFDQLVDLHERVLVSLKDPRLLRKDDPSFLKEHIERRGRVAGVFLKSGELVGYGVVSFPKTDLDNLYTFAPLDETQALRVAHFDGAGVDHRFRGNSIHKVINQMREQCAKMADYHHLMCTISPHNTSCLLNQVANGFMIIDIATKYDNLERMIALKSQDLRLRHLGEEKIEIDIADRDQLFERLNGPWVGYRMIESQGVYKLVCSAL